MTGGSAVPAVYFLSDYGTADEFVGVVHAVLHHRAPRVPVIDLSHQIPPYDVEAGAALLVRCAPHLGAGVVLAVVDPGVGTARRALAVRVGPGTPADGPEWLVGPDNGLLMPLATALGGALEALALHPARVTGEGRFDAGGPTFDGRDVFAPASAHLALGGDPTRLGTAIDPGTLIVAESRGGEGATTAGRVEVDDIGAVVRTSVASVDRFGNVQLGLQGQALDELGLRPGGVATVTLGPTSTAPTAAPTATPTVGGAASTWSARRVGAYADLQGSELGLLVDASGHLALVLDRDSAALLLGLPGPGGAVLVSVRAGG